MQIKRFFAADTRSALQQVREELGPDAVILANRTVAHGVEILCAADYLFAEQSDGGGGSARPPEQRLAASALAENIAPSLSSPLQPDTTEANKGATADRLVTGKAGVWSKTRKNGQFRLGEKVASILLKEYQQKTLEVDQPPSKEPLAEQKPVDTGSEATAAETAVSMQWAERHELEQLRSELQGVRELLSGRFEAPAFEPMPLREQQPLEPLRQILDSRLLRLGLSAVVSAKLLDQLYADQEVELEIAWRHLLAELTKTIPVVDEDRAMQGGVMALIGPTGVGKTTTIGKLAARFVLEHGADQVALVTTDCHRVAAHEQLRTLGRILDIPVKVVDERRDLDSALHSLRDRRLILIDTAGLNPASPLFSAQLTTLANSSTKVDSYLLLPFTSQRQVLDLAVKSYGAIDLAGVMLTKLDEACSLGEALGVVIEHLLPVAYITDGQSIPDDINLPCAQTLVSHAVELMTADEHGADADSVPKESSSKYCAAAVPA